eukprot:TRINITY_DN30606_c0_g2_i1.p1 TRINITY_DN30606_c0_g2~~TRINITY_DN30606_c0_g2_i1.p1  ORF type:complete len:534 (+),score=131.33 TRINITY_DN30606_c0_g2_i1:49-1650(+)
MSLATQPLRLQRGLMRLSNSILVFILLASTIRAADPPEDADADDVAEDRSVDADPGEPRGREEREPGAEAWNSRQPLSDTEDDSNPDEDSLEETHEEEAAEEDLQKERTRLKIGRVSSRKSSSGFRRRCNPCPGKPINKEEDADGADGVEDAQGPEKRPDAVTADSEGSRTLSPRPTHRGGRVPRPAPSSRGLDSRAGRHRSRMADGLADGAMTTEATGGARGSEAREATSAASASWTSPRSEASSAGGATATEAAEKLGEDAVLARPHLVRREVAAHASQLEAASVHSPPHIASRRHPHASAPGAAGASYALLESKVYSRASAKQAASTPGHVEGWIMEMGQCRRMGNEDPVPVRDDLKLIQAGKAAIDASHCAELCSSSESCGAFSCDAPGTQSPIRCSFFAGVHLGNEEPGTLCYINDKWMQRAGLIAPPPPPDPADSGVDMANTLPGVRGPPGPPGRDGLDLRKIAKSAAGMVAAVCIVNIAITALLFRCLFTELAKEDEAAPAGTPAGKVPPESAPAAKAAAKAAAKK